MSIDMITGIALGFGLKVLVITAMIAYQGWRYKLIQIVTYFYNKPSGT